MPTTLLLPVLGTIVRGVVPEVIYFVSRWFTVSVLCADGVLSVVFAGTFAVAVRRFL